MIFPEEGKIEIHAALVKQNVVPPSSFPTFLPTSTEVRGAKTPAVATTSSSDRSKYRLPYDGP